MCRCFAASAITNSTAESARSWRKLPVDNRVDDLRSRLNHQPQELRFGTSGRRAQISHLTQLEVYINVLGELRYLQALDASEGGIRAGEAFFLAHDLRP